VQKRRRDITLVIQGLRSVARHCTVSARAQRFEVLLCDRASAVRGELLRVAALADIAAEPDPDTVLTIRWLLTDGCTSPLYNPAIPAERLHQVLQDAIIALAACTPDRSQVGALLSPASSAETCVAPTRPSPSPHPQTKWHSPNPCTPMGELRRLPE
jgi:hypothetical protein